MEALIVGLWVFSLVLTLAGLRRRRLPVVPIFVPVIILISDSEKMPAAENPSEHEAWLRRRLEGLGK